MRIVRKIIIGIALIAAGFAFGFPFGKNVGFGIGSEWAILQADIIAKEAGQFMPVRFENGTFRLMLKQPRDLYKRVREVANDRDTQDALAEIN